MKETCDLCEKEAPTKRFMKCYVCRVCLRKLLGMD